jgi:siroheme synthase
MSRDDIESSIGESTPLLLKVEAESIRKETINAERFKETAVAITAAITCKQQQRVVCRLCMRRLSHAFSLYIYPFSSCYFLS